MRKRISYIFASLAAAIASSCNFLETEHIGKSDIDGYYSNVEAVESAIYGTHNLTYKLFDKYLILYPTVAADEISLSSTMASWIIYKDFTSTQDDETGPVGNIWKSGYQVINNTNQIIEHTPALRESFPNRVKELNHYLAQAYFLRALVHHQLCLTYAQNYGFTDNASHLGIPIVTKPLAVNATPERNTVAKVYAQIISDLNASLDLYDQSRTSTYLPSYMASKALLARVYLYKGDWAKAAEHASDVIDVVPLTARADYVSMFHIMKLPATTEIIYALNGKSISSRECYKMYWHQEANARPSTRVSDLIDDNDIRKGIITLNDNYICNKYYIEDGVADGYTGINILRASEMYLIRAEARLMQHDVKGAAADIEQLQTRATGTDVKLPAMTEEEMDLLIEQERIRELCFEGHRFWDITRRHKNLERTSDSNSEVTQITYPDYRFVLPIPAVEMESNDKMEQNPTSNE